MKPILTLISIICIAVAGAAQDVMYTTDGRKEEVKLLEINPGQIRYKKTSNPDGPEYSISRSEVILIAYANGTHETFVASGKTKLPDTLNVSYGKNFIAYNSIDLVNTNISFSYERILLNGFLGIRVPLTAGFGNPNIYYWPYSMSIGQGTIAAAGLDLNFYPTGQGRVRYYLAPSFLLTSFYYQYYYGYELDQYGNMIYINNERKLGLQYAVMIKHGVLFQITPHFNMSVALGLGIRQNDTDLKDYTQTKGSFEFNVGYKF